MSADRAPVAVVAHRRKRLGDHTPADLRRALAQRGLDDPSWTEVPKSRMAADAAARARDDGARLLIAWGGDGTVQRCVDALAGSSTELAVIPAGTANLLASAMGIPVELEAAVDVALDGATRRLDLGRMKGEHFSVMAGVGFDARMIGWADRGRKERFGRLAYVAGGMGAAAEPATPLRIDIDGATWFDGAASCVLIGNVGRLIGGLDAFPDASPDDGELEVGVVTADSRLDWARVLARVAVGRGSSSPLVESTRAREIVIRADDRLPYQLDGGERGTATKVTARVAPGALALRTPC